ncbi:MAG: hydrogenase expression/formation protein HypE [Candidatus Magnetoglobus multicellularis str. Araruama]|uniref:Hydrogenase expression/formation protein HypE n=1 Tax=Candidatus Magnetoglobus multicellularis str. Araruama TaxID=890399 RepID=A0A1V1PHH9_9BACT|nr:MAG: hydrogenase expression/formation protein HypE [Candidatus Magnetoglobus multicellularis str. Araruama]
MNQSILGNLNPMPTKHINLDHGSGGTASHRLITGLFLPAFDNPILRKLDDSAQLTIGSTRIAFSTDTFIVHPFFFPGGNIGDLAINGTVNDIAMSGAKPLYLSVGLIIEEGFTLNSLELILNSMKTAAKKANVQIVAGDTKVMPSKALDGIAINTSGLGIIDSNCHISASFAQAGDKILISGTIADHGITVLTQRENLKIEGDIQSDTAPLNDLVLNLISKCPDIHVLRDPTRGGITAALNEIASQSRVEIEILEDAVPIRPQVAACCELLGLDPFSIANEGKLIAFVPESSVERALSLMKQHPMAKDAAVIGSVISDSKPLVYVNTSIGGRRLLHMPVGDQMPRIC